MTDLSQSNPRPKKNHNQTVGKWGEKLAIMFLAKKGYAILQKNYRTPHGELDIVALRDGQTVFIEVKTRTSTRKGYPEDGLTPSKVQHLLAAADDYLADHPEAPADWKIEVVAIVGKPGLSDYQIELFDDISYE
jgi:putative endonuclease